MEGTRIGKIGLMGYPGYIFLQKIRYGYGAQRYDEKRTILHNWYSALRAYLPMVYAKREEDFEKEVAPALADIASQIKAARLAYRSTFENPAIYDPGEQAFEELLEGIEERLDLLTAKTKIIDKIQNDETSGVQM